MMPTHRQPTHPGEFLLEDFLKASTPPITQVDAAARLGWTFVRLNQFVNGKRGVSAENALDLSALTGTTPEFWLNAQATYDLWKARRARDKRGARKVRALRKAS
jgi:addiction module HigA family antidote